MYKMYVIAQKGYHVYLSSTDYEDTIHWEDDIKKAIHYYDEHRAKGGSEYFGDTDVVTIDCEPEKVTGWIIEHSLHDGMFLAHDDHWTTNDKEARFFVSQENAMNFGHFMRKVKR